VEAHQLTRGARRRALAFALLAGCAAAGCAAAVPETRAPSPVVLAERCLRGPFCLTGEVDDQFAAAVEGARCVALGENGTSTSATSDQRGVFFLDGLPALPRDARFEKPGFAAQTVPIVPATAGAASHLYVILHRIDQGECSCESSAIMSGHTACPEDRCGRSRFDTTIPDPAYAPPPESAPPEN
jgi:hypothetical protein